MFPASTSGAAEAERINRPATAIDGTTLQSDGVKITLWGIKPVPPSSVPFTLKALEFLDAATSKGPVNCSVISGSTSEVVARCMSSGSADLGMDLLQNGYALADRRQILGAAFAADYLKAEDTARIHEKGIWRLAAAEEKSARIIPSWLSSYIPLLIPVSIVAAPLISVILIFFVMFFWMRRMMSFQSGEFDYFRKRESSIYMRERNVLITTLEGELEENKSKIAAFLSVYGTMLKDLQKEQGVPKYKQAGDIVQKSPFFSKTVYKANVAKLSMLDLKVAGQLSNLYASMPDGQEYIRLEQDMPLDKAVSAVKEVIAAAESLLLPIDKALSSLQLLLKIKS